MGHLSQAVANLLSRMLGESEREAVLGDLAESGESGVCAVLSVAGLVARRQAALWTGWRPWAALCIAIPAGWYLGRAVIGEVRGLDLWIISNRKDLDPAVLAEYGMSVRHSLIALAQGVVVLTGSAWMSGWAVGWLSRRTARVQGACFAALAAYYPLVLALHWGDFGLVFKLGLTVMLPAALGMRLGRRQAAA